MWEKLKYKIYHWRVLAKNKKNYIDSTSTIHRSAKILNAEIHGKVCIQEKATIHQCLISGDISIGRFTTLWGPNIYVLSAIHPITIGNFCSIARDVTIQEYFHDYERLSTYFIGRNIFGEDLSEEVLSKGPITIGHDVWIGTGAQIMSGISIGHGAVIGANAVVTKDVPPYAIVGGNPAQLIKYRFNGQTIDRLLQMNWWDWDLEKIKSSKELFNTKIVN